jgi:hypothetical protein
MLRRLTRVVVLTILVTLVATGTAGAAPPFPEQIQLPDGFQPEGIAIGNGSTFYVGAIQTGAIYRGDLRTGEGAVITPPSDGSASIGIAIDHHGRLFVAGGATGEGRVIDAGTGDVIRVYQLNPGATFVNDVVIADGAAWFTDSFNPVLYRVPLDLGPVETVPLTGDLVYEDGFNVNGIDATPDGHTLILVQSNTGELFTADPGTGITHEIDLGGESVPSGDGILLVGRTLYVVQNQLNVIAVVELSPDLATGVVVDRLEPEGVDVPTTIDRWGNRLYAVNARFTTPVTPTTDYWITAVRRH